MNKYKPKERKCVCENMILSQRYITLTNVSGDKLAASANPLREIGKLATKPERTYNT